MPLSSTLPPDFVYVRAVVPTIAQDIRYATAHNFVGAPLPGYEAGECVLTKAAAYALKTVHARLQRKGFGLKVYDCYRPVSAVEYLISWSQRPDDQKMKAEFYPRVDKAELFALGYLAKHSGHSRGSTVDVTLIRWPTQASVPMGTDHDFLDPMACRKYPIGYPASHYRKVLSDSMEAAGFIGYTKEWWHFSLQKEPYPQHAFAFAIRKPTAFVSRSSGYRSLG